MVADDFACWVQSLARVHDLHRSEGRNGWHDGQWSRCWRTKWRAKQATGKDGGEGRTESQVPMRPAFLDTVHIICGTNDISRQLKGRAHRNICLLELIPFLSETTAEVFPYEQDIATLFLVDELPFQSGAWGIMLLSSLLSTALQRFVLHRISGKVSTACWLLSRQ